jgi:hypothetical protein
VYDKDVIDTDPSYAEALARRGLLDKLEKH